MIDEKAASKIHDEAREKIAEICGGQVVANPYVKADQILNLSGTTDIMCDECDGGWHEFIKPCPKCQGEKSIKHKWKIAVVLENGELPPLLQKQGKRKEWLEKDLLRRLDTSGYRQVVE